MQNGKAKGEYRWLTPQEIGSTVAMFRKMMDWKQFTLAHEAGVHERTVQRIERGEKVDDGSLQKVGRALRLRDPGFIGPRYIESEEEQQAQFETMLKEVMVIEARNFSSVKDCEAVLASDGYSIRDSALPEEMAEQMAALRDVLIEWADIYADLSHTEKLNACRSVLSAVRELEGQGFSMRYGVYDTDDRFKVAVLLFGPSKDQGFVNLSQFVVPRNFTKLAIASLRG